MNLDQNLYNEIKSSTNIISGKEYKNILFAITHLASDLVKPTLGPYGSTTIVDDSLMTYPTKDGYTVLKDMRFNDPVYNTLYNVIKQIPFSIVSKVGDGTTSATIGAAAFLDAILDYNEKLDSDENESDYRQADLMKDLDFVKEMIIKELMSDKYLHLVDLNKKYKDGHSDIWRIANVASNNNEKLSNIIDKIYSKTANPNIYITYDNIGTDLSYEIQTGYKLDCNPTNLKVYVNTDQGEYKINRPTLVAIFDHNITFLEHGQFIQSLSEYAGNANMDIIIMAPHYDDIISSWLGNNINTCLQHHALPNLMMIQVPLTVEIHREYLSDFAMLTNANPITSGIVKAFNLLVAKLKDPSYEAKNPIEESIISINSTKYESTDDLIKECLGQINTATIGQKYIVITDYEKNIVNPDVYKESLKEAKHKYDTLYAKSLKSSTNLTKEYLEAYQRYSKLRGSMGIIKIGGSSELEKHCLKDAVDDAVLACRSAFENGYVRGLNLSTLSAIQRIKNDSLNNKITLTPRQIDILEMFQYVFFKISYNVFENKYHKKTDAKHRVYLKLDESVDFTDMTVEDIVNTCVTKNYGFNLITNTFESNDDLWIINSVSTDVEILTAIVSTLSLILTSSQFISMSQSYDKNTTRKQAMTTRCRDQEDLAAATVKGIKKEFPDIENLFKPHESLSHKSKSAADNLYNAAMNMCK
jgi:chaperonin GroEL